MNCYAIAFFSALGFAATVIAQSPKELTQLSAAITKAHAAIDRADATPQLAGEVIKKSKALDGSFVVSLSKTKMEESVGMVTLRGFISSPRGKKERYRTEDERRAIEDLSESVQAAKDTLAEASKTKHSGDTATSNSKDVPPDPALKKQAEATYKKTQRAMADFVKKVNAISEQRRKRCEEVEIEIIAPSSAKESLDVLEARIKVNAYPVVVFIDTEPEELGGSPRIKKLILNTDIAAKEKPPIQYFYEKNAPESPDEIAAAIAEQRLLVGMTLAQAKDAMRAEGQTVSANDHEQTYRWKLGGNRMIHARFRGGRLVDWRYSNY